MPDKFLLETEPFHRLSLIHIFFRGQEVDILQPGREPFTATLDELYNEDGEAIQVAPHAEMVVRWKTDLPVEAGAYLRVKKEPRSE